MPEVASTSVIKLKLHFAGGAETLLNGKRDHNVEIQWEEKEMIVYQLLDWILQNLLKTCDKPELLICNGNIRPGILLLVNDTDWEILGAVS